VSWLAKLSELARKLTAALSTGNLDDATVSIDDLLAECLRSGFALLRREASVSTRKSPIFAAALGIGRLLRRSFCAGASAPEEDKDFNPPSPHPKGCPDGLIGA